MLLPAPFALPLLGVVICAPVVLAFIVLMRWNEAGQAGLAAEASLGANL